MIDKLGERTILVTLLPEDMRAYMLDFNAGVDGEQIRSGLTRLMYRVGEECGMDHRDKSYLIEALPGRDGCLLIISVRHMKRRRRYRIKRERIHDCCRFESADDMLDWLHRGKIPSELGYTLYLFDGTYYMLPDRPLSQAVKNTLNEYGRLTGENLIFIARVREYGTEVKRKFPTLPQPKYASIAAI